MEFLLYKNDIFIKKVSKQQVEDLLGKDYKIGTLCKGYRAVLNEETDPTITFMNAQSDPKFYAEELSASELEEIEETNKIYEYHNQ